MYLLYTYATFMLKVIYRVVNYSKRGVLVPLSTQVLVSTLHVSPSVQDAVPVT